MIFYKNEKQACKNAALVSLALACLLGCGGGGSDKTTGVSSTPTDTTTNPVVIPLEETVVDYEPDTEKLLNTAEDSGDLYVEPMFNFDSFKSVRFDINAVNNLNQSLSDVMMTISVIDKNITEYDDPLLQGKSLLTKVFTDANGQINITLEIPQSVTKLLLELNALGLENDVIYLLGESEIVTHNFAQN